MAEDLAGLSIPIEASTALLREQMEAAAQVVGGTTDRIDRNLAKVDKAFDRLDQASRAVTRTVGAVKKDLETTAAAVGTAAERINRSLGIIGQGTNTRARAADIEAWGRELDRLEAKFDPVTTATKRYEAELADLATAQRAGIVVGAAYEQQLQRITDSYDPVTIAARKLKEAAEKEAVAFQALEDRLDSHGAAARRAADDQAKLDKALAEGRISNDRYTALSRALRDTGTAGETAAKGTKLASHELTNLTYQLQDAAVQLAGGQSPFLILMQQGPQATGAVGGVGRALSLLASPAGLATLGIGAVAGAFALVVGAGESYQRKLAEVSTANRMMGGQVGATADQLEQLATRAADAASISVSAARDQETAYIRVGKIGTESMEKLIALSRDYAAGSKQSAEEASADLASMFKDPVAAAEKLQASYGILTAKEMEHVRQLKATGREEEARVLVADKLAVRVRGLADTTTSFAQAWERVGRAVSNAFNAVGEAVAPETNGQAIRRLEAERQRLIDARKLDRARIDAETGGAASADAVPVDSRFSAPGTGAAGNQRMIEIEAELVRRRATEARAREQAAIRKNNQDRDRFGVEASEITRAARPLGDQIDQVTEKVTKLRRAFGPDMAGASDETKRALSGFENQLADLQEASKRGVDLEAYKRQKLADVDKQAAGMVGPSRERFLAEQHTVIDLIGTATSATERKIQVDQAGAAATNSQTQAVAQQNAQTTAAIAGQVAAADAYQRSLAAGIEADARRQAQSEAVTSAIDVEARTRQIVAEKAADQAVSLAQTTQQLDLETEAQRQVVKATDDGIAARMEADRKAQVTKTTSEALAAAQAAEATGNGELAKKLRELAAGYDNASKAASELSKLDALKQYNQQQRDGLELARNEASLVGKSADDRTRARAAYQAELQIRQKGIDVTKQLSAEQLQEVERTRQLAAETADWQIATQHAEAAWQGVGDAIDDGVVRPLESAVDAIVKGQGETVKWANVARGALTSLAADIGKMATINPLKNALGLGSNSPSLWDLPMLGGGGQQQVIRNADGSISYAPAMQGVGGTWMSQPVFGQQVAPSKDFVGPMPASEGLLGWNPSYGQLAMGGLAVAGGIAAATQRNASTGQVIGGGLTAAGGVLLTLQNSYAKTAGAILTVGGALLAAVSGAKDRGDAYSISHITLGANGKYALGASAQDNNGDATRFNADANKIAKGINDIAARLNLKATTADSYIDTKTKSAEQAALELLKGMQSAVPAVAYALAHETSTSLEEALSHLEFANGFDQQIAGLRSSISDLFTDFQTGIDDANTFARGLLDTVTNSSTVFAVAKGATLPGFARGTLSAPAGWAVVGEEGPEVVRLAGGERIWTARESAQMLAQMGQGRDDTLIHLRGGDELAAVRRALGHPGTINPETGLLGFEYGGGDHGSPGSGGSAGSGGGSDSSSSGSSGSGTSGGFGGGMRGVGSANAADGTAHSTTEGRNSAYGGSWGAGSGGGVYRGVNNAYPTNEEIQASAAAVDNVYGTSLSGWLTNAALEYGLNIKKSIGVDPATGLNNTRLSINAGGVIGDIASLATGIPGLGLAMGALADALDVDHIVIGSIDANGIFSGATGSASSASGATARDGGDPDRHSVTLAAAEARAAAERDATAAAQKAAADAAAQKAAQRAALQVQFDAVGLAQDRVDQLNTIVKSLGDGTFSPIGQDFDTLATDMKRAATAYTAAGQAVPDALFGATKQMEALGAVRQRLLAEVDGVTVETSAEEKKVEQIKGQWSSSATDLVKAFNSVGIAGDALTASLTKGLTNALNKERKSYSDSLDAALRKSKGEEGYDSALSLIDSYKTSIKDVNALWPEGAEQAGQLTKVTDTLTGNLEGLVKSGSITSTSLQQIISDFSDTPAVVTAAAAALKQLNDTAEEAARQFNAGVSARAFAAVGNDRTAQLIGLDEQQKKELKAAQDAGNDVTTLVQVQASERATKAYELANADLLAAYDQQIGATQDLITELQEGAIAAAKVADQFIKARNSLAISDDAPISPGEKLAEAARQWNEALATVRSDTASESAKTDARAVLTQLGPTLVSIEKANSAGTARTWYDAVMQVFGELGDKTALGVDTADQQLEAAQDTLKELQQGRRDAANAAQKQYGAISDLKSVAEQSKAEMLAALAPLQRLNGSAVTAPHYSASAQVQTAWDGLSGAQQLGIARAMGWGGQLDEAFNVWLAMDSARATAFGANVTSIAGGARYAAPEDVGRAWEALTQTQQLAAVRAAGYDGGIDAGLNAWVQLGHQAAFEAAVRAQAHTAQVPGFATGGMHAGGLRIVGERGPELEATGPARIWTADQIATAVSAARGELGPTVVGFLPAALGGGSGIATLVKAVEAVGGRIDRLSGQIETFARAGAQQAAGIGADMVRTLDRIQDELQDLPVRIAGAS